MLNKYYFFLDNPSGTPPTPPAPLSVSLSQSGNTLTATIAGGTTPYRYGFAMSGYGGSCGYVGNISNPNGTTSSSSVSTTFNFVAYSGTTYTYSCSVTDNNGIFANSNIVTITPCLVPETLITLKNGTQKQLEKLKVGEELFGENNQVEAFETYHVGTLYSINEGLLKSSIGHIHLVNGGQQVQALNLKIGDKLKNIEGEEVKIYSIEKIQGQIFKVVNISTTNKTYVANGIYTHNKTACPG